MKTIYTPIAVSSGEFPPIEKRYGIYSEDVTVFDLDNDMHICFYDFDKGCWRNRFGLQVQITSWLKKEEVPELTEEEIEKLAREKYKFQDGPDHSWDAMQNQRVKGFIAGYIAATKASKVEVKWEDNMK